VILRIIYSERERAEGLQREVLEVAREAIRRVHGSQKAFAIALGMNPSDVTRMAQGLYDLHLALMARDQRVLDEFAVLLARHQGHELTRADRRQRLLREQEDLQLRLFQVTSQLKETA
jgi:hypothetical protein